MAEVSSVVHGAGGRLEVIIATAWDCPFDGPTPLERTVDVAARAVELGADQLCLGDTIGTTSPARTVRLIEAVRDACPGVDLGAHFHNTRGQGIANALAALQIGVVQLDASVGGMGGCPFAPGASGNIATEELVYLLDDAGVSTGIDGAQCWRRPRWLRTCSATRWTATCCAPGATLNQPWPNGDHPNRRVLVDCAATTPQK